MNQDTFSLFKIERYSRYIGPTCFYEKLFLVSIPETRSYTHTHTTYTHTYTYTHTHTHHTHILTHTHTYHNHGLASQVYASCTFPFPLAFGRRRGSLRRRQRRGVAPLRQRLHGLDKPCEMARNNRGPPLSSNHEWRRG